MFPISHNLPLGASIWIKRWRWAHERVASCRELERFRLGADAALCGSLLRSRMPQDVLLCPGSLRSTGQRCGHRCMSFASALLWPLLSTSARGTVLMSSWSVRGTRACKRYGRSRAVASDVAVLSCLAQVLCAEHAGSDAFHFVMELRIESNPPCEPAHILVTALARCARRSGGYVRALVAFLLAGCFSIMAGMTSTMQGTRAISRAISR